MPQRVDIKSLVIGLLLGVCVMLARGQVSTNTSNNSGTTQTNQPPTYEQRYQITAVSEEGKTVIYVIDHRYEKVYRYTHDGHPWESSDEFEVNH